MKRETSGEEPTAGLARLPPGRHGLSREFVVKNQRDRLASGMIAAVAEHGYHEVTITQIAAAAGVSRRTFYGYFASKEECFFNTYELAARHLDEAMSTAGQGHGEWPERVRARLLAMLETFAANPDLARFCLIAPPNAGGKVADRYRLLLERFLAILVEGRPPSPITREPSPAVEQGLVGGIASLIVREVKAGEGERLPGLLPDLLELVLAPYLGHAEAVRVARQPR